MVEAGAVNQRKVGLDKVLVKDAIEVIDLNKALSHSGNCYLFTVHCDAMIEAGINRGDQLIADRGIKAANGNIVIADLNGDLLIRRLKLVNGKMQLLPAADLSPIMLDYYDPSLIWGVVTYVIQKVL